MNGINKMTKNIVKCFKSAFLQRSYRGLNSAKMPYINPCLPPVVKRSIDIDALRSVWVAVVGKYHNVYCKLYMSYLYTLDLFSPYNKTA